ncbi:MAG: WYL domain-containing protein, partial [Anaerolineae bacterium]|nr:WYL domain-containing protein [Anaerolineae bacterium]
LAAELEVSERTIYRDIEALSASGVPVYGEPGREGGFSLSEGYRTSLTGLTPAETQALFMFALSIPRPLVDLGVGGELKSALRKLAAALPDVRRGDEAHMRQRFHLDAETWDGGPETTPFLDVLHRAVRENRRVRLCTPSLAGVRVEIDAEPLGLVAKAGAWYVVYRQAGRLDARRVADLLDARLLSERFERPQDFDLAEAWAAWRADFGGRRAVYGVQVRAARAALPGLLRRFGEPLQAQVDEQAPRGDAPHWELALTFTSLESARDYLLAYGRSVEVVAPLPLRRSIQDYAEQIVALYGGEG